MASSTPRTSTAYLSEVGRSGRDIAAKHAEGLRPLDVLAGRSGKPKEELVGKQHPGTELFKATIARNLHAYYESNLRKNRIQVVTNVIDELRAEGCRFLKYDSQCRLFIVLDEKKVRDMVTFAFRHHQNKTKRPKQKLRTPALCPEASTTTMQSRNNNKEEEVTYITTCGPLDILGGRKGRSKARILGEDHPGSIIFDEAIASNLQAYISDDCRARRSHLIRNVINELLAHGCRFLKYEAKLGAFLVMGEKQIRDKVSFAFRDHSVAEKKKQLPLGKVGKDRHESAKEPKRPERRQEQSRLTIAKSRAASKRRTKKKVFEAALESVILKDKERNNGTAAASLFPTRHAQTVPKVCLENRKDDCSSFPETVQSAGPSTKNVVSCDYLADPSEQMANMLHSRLIDRIVCKLVASVVQT